MHGRKHIHRVAALLTAVAALASFTGSVQAANSSPAGMTKTEYRALMLRGEALNRQYGLGSGTYEPGTIGWQEEYRALVLRSKALNAKYGLRGAHVVASTPPATVAENGFVWGDFAIGAAAMLGLVVLSGGILAGAYVTGRGRTPILRPR